MSLSAHAMERMTGRRGMRVTRRRIMVFSHLCNADHMTGAEKYALFLAQELTAHHQVILVVPSEGMLARQARSTSAAAVLVHPYPLMWQMWEPGPGLAEEEHRIYHSEQTLLMMNMLHSYRPDAVIVITCVNTIPAIAASRLGIPVLWMITEVMRSTPFTPHAVSIIDRYSAWIGGISQATLNHFHRHAVAKTLMLSPSWRRDLLHPETWDGHRRKTRAAYGVGGKDVVGGYIVSDIVPHKGFDHFVEMAIRLCGRHPDFRCMIVGQATDRAYYDSTMQYMHRFGYSSRFVLVPYTRSIENLYPAMDFVVVPSLVDEGFGMTAMEGMIFGKPVIAYRSGGLEEILQSTGMASLLVPPGDIDRLTEAASELVGNPVRRAALGREAQRAVEEAYGISAYRSRLSLIMQAIEQTVLTVERHHRIMRPNIPDGSVIKGAHTPAVYLIQDGRKRPFASEAALHASGYGWREVIIVEERTLHSIPTGSPIL